MYLNNKYYKYTVSYSSHEVRNRIVEFKYLNGTATNKEPGRESSAKFTAAHAPRKDGLHVLGIWAESIIQWRTPITHLMQFGPL